MNLVDAVKLALIYRKIPAESFKAYTKLVECTAEHFDMSDAKSIRFEKDHKKVTSVCNKNSVTITTPNPLDADSDVTVVCYAVTIKGKDGAPDIAETGHRYMFYSDKFSDAFSVRVFPTLKKFNKFKSCNTVNILNEFEFRGATFILYESKDSKVERVAIFCSNDCDLSPDELAKEISYNTTGVSAEKTSVFG